MKNIIRTILFGCVAVIAFVGCEKPEPETPPVDDPDTRYIITVRSNNNAWGTVTGGGLYAAGDSAVLAAVPAEGCLFVGWEDGTSYTPRTITVSGNAEYMAHFSADPEDPDAPNTYDDWVDLGLPSGLLWATRNVGAASPVDYGDYFAWGETTPKSVYEWSSYRYCNRNYYHWDYDHQLTKYCFDLSFGHNGFTDTLTVLQPEDDAATANYGGRTPTIEEWRELYNHTTSQWMDIGGLHGRLFTGPNGNTLFLPAACHSYGFDGDYWSSSLSTLTPSYARSFHFNSDYVGVPLSNIDLRCYGRSVRAVCEADKN